MTYRPISSDNRHHGSITGLPDVGDMGGSINLSPALVLWGTTALTILLTSGCT